MPNPNPKRPRPKGRRRLFNPSVKKRKEDGSTAKTGSREQKSNQSSTSTLLPGPCPPPDDSIVTVDSHDSTFQGTSPAPMPDTNSSNQIDAENIVSITLHHSDMEKSCDNIPYESSPCDVTTSTARSVIVIDVGQSNLDSTVPHEPNVIIQELGPADLARVSAKISFESDILNRSVADCLEQESVCDQMEDALPAEPKYTDADTSNQDNSCIPTDAAELLDFVKERLHTRLPGNSVLVTASEGIQVGLTARTELLIVQRAAFFDVDGRIVAGLHGKNIPSHHTFWQGVRHVPLIPETTDEFIENVLTVVRSLRALEVCKGVEFFQHLWENAPNCHIDYNPYQEYRYTETCRSDSCSLLVSGLTVKRCDECKQVWQSLRERNKTRPANLDSSPSKFKPHKYLSTPEKEERMQKASVEMEKIKRINRDLKQQLQKFKTLTRKEGVQITKELSDNFAAILN